MQDDATARPMEATDVALDGDIEAPMKDKVEEKAAYRAAGANGLFNNLVVAADKGDGGGGSRAKDVAG